MSLERFKLAWQRTGMVEKGYVNNSKDSGGETNFGITIAVARAYGYSGPMSALPFETATAIAKQNYWDVLSLDDIAALSEEVADKLFDLSILAGQPTAAEYFQRLLNLFNMHGDRELYSELKEDRRVGKVTVYALKMLLADRGKSGETVVLRALNCQEGSHFIDIVRAKPIAKDAVFGWFLNRVG